MNVVQYVAGKILHSLCLDSDRSEQAGAKLVNLSRFERYDKALNAWSDMQQDQGHQSLVSKQGQLAEFKLLSFCSTMKL